MACDPATLANAAKCFSNCLGPDDLDSITVQLMCNWATTGNATAAAGSAFAILTEASDLILTDPLGVDFLEIEH